MNSNFPPIFSAKIFPRSEDKRVGNSLPCFSLYPAASTEETGFNDDENSNITNTTVTESEFNENDTISTSVTTTGFNINSTTTTTISSMTTEVKEPPGLMDFLSSVLLILLRHKFGIKLGYFIN